MYLVVLKGRNVTRFEVFDQPRYSLKGHDPIVPPAKSPGKTAAARHRTDRPVWYTKAVIKAKLDRVILGRGNTVSAPGENRKKDSGTNGRLQAVPGSLRGLIERQWPVVAAAVLVELLARTEGYGSSIFSVVAVAFLSVVLYTSLRYGVSQGLLSAAIVIAYNSHSLVGAIESFSFSDRNVRRVLLLAVVLPLLAYIVGRLAERNEYLLQREKGARRKAEDSEQQLRFMAESMPQKIFTTAPDGRADYVNLQWSEYSGLSPRQIASKGWISLVHPDDVEANTALWQHSLATGEPFEYEHRLRSRGGSYRWHVSRARALRKDDGSIGMWVGSSTDIHDIKTALQREHKLERATVRLTEQREELLELNKTKDEFISLASHQLRTPATGVKQYIGMVLEGYAGDITPGQRTFLTQAYESNEREITIINDLLKVAKLDAGKVTLRKEKANIVSLIRNTIDEQSSKFAQRQQKVVFRPKQSRLFAAVDEKYVRMVLENIIDNASKYTPHGKAIYVSVKKSKGGLAIGVQDEGVGIEQKDADKVFNKFSRIDNPLSVQVGGSGLGLYWAKKVIDLHGGSINIESRPGEGSTFTILLPA